MLMQLTDRTNSDVANADHFPAIELLTQRRSRYRNAGIRCKGVHRN